MLGFDFDNNPGEHPIWLTEDHCTNILAILKIGLGKESIKKRASCLRSFGLILKNNKCIYFYPIWEGTVIPVQPGVWKGSENLLASKQASIFGYLQLPSPHKTAGEKSNTVQGISHGLTTLHLS